MLPEYYLNAILITLEYYLNITLNLVGEIFGGREEVYANVFLTALNLSETVGAHYTYTVGKRQTSQPRMMVEEF